MNTSPGATLPDTSSAAAVSTPAAAAHPARGPLMLGALGVVFGDIGTSPIYAFRESIKAAEGPGCRTGVIAWFGTAMVPSA